LSNLRPWFCQAATISQVIKYLGVFISILYIHKFAFIFVAFSASMSGTSPARLERKHEGEGPNNYEQKHHHSSYKNTKIIIFISVGC